LRTFIASVRTELPGLIDYPDGGHTLFEYTDAVIPRHTVEKVKETLSGPTIDTYTYVDGLDRPIQKVALGEAGQTIVTRKTYDNMGRNDSITGPFFAAGTTWPQKPLTDHPLIEKEYDYRGMLALMEKADGVYGSVIWTFSNSAMETIATDPDGRVKATVKDHLGRIVQVQEDGGQNTDYTYNAAGDLVEVDPPQIIPTTIQYDLLGRKISMDDPDMGYWTYHYDANDNLVEQIDAESQSTLFRYDELNRLTRKEYSTPDATIYYHYDGLSTANGNGQFTLVTNGSVITEFDAYDEMGRQTSVTKTIQELPVGIQQVV